ncbi:MAG: biotin transporter BioY [Dehalococcoidia bacterium]
MTPALGRTLISIPDTRPLARASWATLLVVGGIAFLAATAQVRIPLPGTPVPVTGQTFGVLLLAAAYGSRLGAVTVGSYLLVGFAGAPIFQNGGAGTAALYGATGGYLVGFLAAAWIVGELAEHGWDRKPYLVVAAMIAGNAIIYACGVTHLAEVRLPNGAAIGWDRVWALGVAPFLLGDAIKIALAAALLPIAWRLKERGAPRA